MLEVRQIIDRFGQEMYGRRTNIERDFLQLGCFGAGLGPLPRWVRRIWRRTWRVRHRVSE
jgi:hypothetical protein